MTAVIFFNTATWPIQYDDILFICMVISPAPAFQITLTGTPLHKPGCRQYPWCLKSLFISRHPYLTA